MKIFNAIQVAMTLAAGPILLQLLWLASFTFARPLFYICAIGYLILFVWVTSMVAESFEK